MTDLEIIERVNDVVPKDLQLVLILVRTTPAPGTVFAPGQNFSAVISSTIDLDTTTAVLQGFIDRNENRRGEDLGEMRQ
jgi:hypothetical protein